ncbi:sterile alpha motif domain-containing protein 1 [Lepisosteus oculatus]|uniref:sterile alpha motif domain-containing protein 1 n=1 Tax=Lepisosteus oculatus TaxID=7918 RepID=UPI000740307D|nr:PREDICTED: atherin-like [Lepisosteus oculatus]
MSEPKYRDWILETIDSLRSRKARPDLDRICRMVRRRHGSDPDRTRLELEKLIQEQTVLKVSYKGSISYRNAAKVQRKSRKKIDQGAGAGGGGAVGDQTKNADLNNDGDTAPSPVERKDPHGKGAEGCGARQSDDPQPKTGGISEKDEGDLVPSSGNSCLCCGAAACKSQPRAAPGSSVNASASREKKPQEPSREKGTDNGSSLANKTRGTRGVEASLPERECYNSNKQRRTCSHHGHTQTHLKPKCKVGPAPKASRSSSDEPNPDLGDRLVASVRSLAERRGPCASRGHTSLGLKEILGFLSSHERLSEEKLTRSKVKVVLEREVARGRLRRTRFGNITLPVRGAGVKSTARLAKSALQGRQSTKKEEKDTEGAMETDASEEETPPEPEDKGSAETPSPDQQDQELTDISTAAAEREGKDTLSEEGNTKGFLPDIPTVASQDSILEQKQECTSSKVKECSFQMDTCKDKEMEAVLPSENKISEQCTLVKVLPISHVDLQPSSCSVPDLVKECTVEKCQRSSYAIEDMLLVLQENTEASEEVVPQEAVCLTVQGDVKNGEEKMQMEEVIVIPEEHVPDSSTTQVRLMECSEGVTLSSVPAQSRLGCKMEVGVASCLLTPSASPGDTDTAEERVLNGDLFVKSEKPGIDPMDWTVSDVVSYFTAAGFGEQAGAFRTQEIDGKSLLLMQRNDVLTGLSIRLGPALKIYEYHVKVLQRTHFQDDSTIC